MIIYHDPRLYAELRNKGVNEIMDPGGTLGLQASSPLYWKP